MKPDAPVIATKVEREDGWSVDMARRRSLGERPRLGRSDAHVENVTPAGDVPLQLAARQDAARDLLRHRDAAIGVVCDAAADLVYALAARPIARGLQRPRAQSIVAPQAVVSGS